MSLSENQDFKKIEIEKNVSKHVKGRKNNKAISENSENSRKWTLGRLLGEIIFGLAIIATFFMGLGITITGAQKLMEKQGRTFVKLVHSAAGGCSEQLP